MTSTRTMRIEAAFDISGMEAAILSSLRVYRNGAHVDPSAVTFSVEVATPSTGLFENLPDVKGFSYAITFEIMGAGQALHYPPERFHSARFIPSRRVGLLEADFEINLYNGVTLSIAVLGFTEMGEFGNPSAGGDYRIDLIPSVSGDSALAITILDSGQSFAHNWQVAAAATADGISADVAAIQAEICHLMEDLNVRRYFKVTPELPYGDAVGEDSSSIPGAPIIVCGWVSSLETPGGGEQRTVTMPVDLRSLLGVFPDKGVWIEQVRRDGSPLTALSGGLSRTLFGVSKELDMSGGSALTVAHASIGAA